MKWFGSLCFDLQGESCMVVWGRVTLSFTGRATGHLPVVPTTAPPTTLHQAVPPRHRRPLSSSPPLHTAPPHLHHRSTRKDKTGESLVSSDLWPHALKLYRHVWNCLYWSLVWSFDITLVDHEKKSSFKKIFIYYDKK